MLKFTFVFIKKKYIAKHQNLNYSRLIKFNWIHKIVWLRYIYNRLLFKQQSHYKFHRLLWIRFRLGRIFFFFQNNKNDRINVDAKKKLDSLKIEVHFELRNVSLFSWESHYEQYISKYSTNCFVYLSLFSRNQHHIVEEFLPQVLF